jgi:hypothetical protein
VYSHTFTEPVSGTLTLLCHIGVVIFVFEKQAYQLAVVNMTDINNASDSVYRDIMIVAEKKRTSTSLLNQIHNHKIKKRI